MSRTRGRLLLAGAATVLGVAPARAQAPDTVTFRGVVVEAGTGTPVPFSIVQLLPALGQRFSDQDGVFAFGRLAAGPHRLRVRQIGYRPLDTTVTVAASGPAVRIGLLHIAIRLPAVTVTGVTSCVRPGPPDPSLNPALATIFDQLLENARRYALLADSYPHRYSARRSFTEFDRTGRAGVPSIDTVVHASWVRAPYRPGEVVGPPDQNNERVVRMPTLPDFADSAFVYTHCFWLVGRDTVEGESFVRVDFAPGPKLQTPDVAGAAYLDSLGYQLAFINIRLTRAERVTRGGGPLDATSHFNEVYPGIPLIAWVRATQRYGSPRRRDDPVKRVEEQRLLRVEFLRSLIP